ncbi:subclass B3 metallo-beta-lactamase [Luteimonas marina]|uniref:Subclass B3 metallo-beta-lactamase n=1 Tax=Luteimonas marina TaxID=488485 RepID=A0A5C5UE17_9GAMM|nr:subclass B3 metallo-beta-lactamase [Luteimonas marina]TWT23772.1 subclass B3 metallo-beta-lactamase [Luteimonas marina]
MRCLTAAACLLVLTACQPAEPGSAPTATAPDHAPPAPSEPADIPACPADADVMAGWDERAPPRRVFGNTWYVGTCGLTALLVTSDQGHVLLDGATEAAATSIEANIRALGFDPADVAYIVNSHEHFDHAAGIAGLQRATGARVLVRVPAVPVLLSGRSGRNDPQMLELTPFPPVAEVDVIADGDTVQAGPLTLTAHATPGHAPGGTSWSWQSCEGERCLDIAYVDSVSAISDKAYRYLDHPATVDAFRGALDTIAELPCDVLITPHPLASDLFARIDGKAPLQDAGACRRYADTGRANLDKRLAREKTGAAP